MRSIRDSVETVNAAATAIVSAEARVQPSRVQKRRWASCWSLYWCFGSYKHRKRIGHAVLISQPTAQVPVTSYVENMNQTTTITLPFIAPPSSPASFLPSDPPSASHSPVGLLSLASLSVHACSQGMTAPIFVIGPYAHETQLVSPPVFSTFTTEPSTASFTPPPELVQMTTPSSPEVPFAQLLSSSLAQKRRNSGTMKYPLSHYDFQPYQYPGSPGGHIKSPGSVVSTSGSSSPFPDKRTNTELHMVEPPKFVGYEHFLNYKWGSRVGSGSITPNGWGSRLGSGALTPNGGLSRLGSGTLTPNGAEPPSRDSNLLENQSLEVVSLANSELELESHAVVDHRVSFELTGEDIPTCIVKEAVLSPKFMSATIQEAVEGFKDKDLVTDDAHSCRTQTTVESDNAVPGRGLDGKAEECHQKHRTISLGSSKDFNFHNTKDDSSDKSGINCEWWIDEKVGSEDLGPKKNWTFFPMLQSGVS
ncbi:hydroxyproline-rich glycoprotein family protein [Perilla frutescens var. frutescens]|nr:hydroxyproline-rich glycoprotein family protein [Perilla frutescens var. frutescens]